MAGVEANREQASDPSTTGPNADHSANPDPENGLYRFLRFCLQVVTPVYFRYRARGLEHVPKRGPALFVVNHQSFLDPVMVGIPISRASGTRQQPLPCNAPRA